MNYITLWGQTPILHTIIGTIGGSIYLVSLYWIAVLMNNLVGLNVNLLDPLQHFYTSLPLGIAGLISWSLKRKYIGVGLLLSYPLFYLTMIVLLSVACSMDVGNCL